MIISSEVVLHSLAIHKINEEHGLQLSNQVITIEDEALNQLLVKYFFKSFKEEERYRFTNEEDLIYNPVYTTASKIFADPSSLFEHSKELARLLAQKSQNQNIKDGDVFITFFDDCVVDDEVTTAIGIFKVENKDTYIKIMGNEDVFDIRSEEGISINKLDKGLIIFDTDKENGYRTLLVDKTNTSGNAQYWQDEFLGVEPFNDEYFQTQNVINNFQEFAQQAFEGQTKTEKIALVNESVDYLKDNNQFDQQDYQQTILQTPELIEKYENFQEKKYEEDPEHNPSSFEISNPAIKNTKRFIKSIIKLDKSFHVYVHGSRKNIIKGYDNERKQNFYTLYFDSEE